jgi:hypothetical protein
MGEERFEITLDFYADLSQMLRCELQLEGYQVGADEDPFEVCKKYFNVQKRKIAPKPREVLISRQFNCPQEFQTAVDAIRDKARKGGDLKPHLSKTLLDADYNDGLLNDWGIHHFHLSSLPDREQPVFVERTGPLLFARVTDEHFYMINVMKHQNWTNRNLIEILHANWPESIAGYRLQGIKGPSYSEDDLKRFRKGGVMTCIEVSDGTVYAPPGGGYASTGVSIEVVRQCHYLKNETLGLGQWVTQNADTLVADARAQAQELKIGPQLRFRLVELSRERALMLEENSGVRFPLLLSGKV